MRKRLIASFLALSCLAVAFAGVAGSGKALDLDAVRTQQAEIRSGINAGTGLYKDMSDNTRRDLMSRQDRVLRLIDGKSTDDQLSESQKVALFNDLEWIEAAINRTEDERMVCERRKKLGSNRMERVCMTAAQQRELRERARDEMIHDSRNMRLGN